MLASVLFADWIKLHSEIVVACVLGLVSPKTLFMLVQSMAASMLQAAECSPAAGPLWLQ
jgi:hypothetical protein